MLCPAELAGHKRVSRVDQNNFYCLGQPEQSLLKANDKPPFKIGELGPTGPRARSLHSRRPSAALPLPPLEPGAPGTAHHVPWQVAAPQAWPLMGEHAPPRWSPLILLGEPASTRRQMWSWRAAPTAARACCRSYCRPEADLARPQSDRPSRSAHLAASALQRMMKMCIDIGTGLR